MTKLIVESGILKSRNKVGKLPQDENGYYHMTLALFDTKNHGGIFYPMTDLISDYFRPNSSLMVTAKENNLRSEIEHPKFEPGMTKGQYLNRLRTIDLKLACNHIKRLELTNTKDHRGNDCVAVTGWIKPSGYKPEVLTGMLNNPDENVSYSLRSVVKEGIVKGIHTRYVTEICTFDLVNQGGHLKASKYRTDGLESIADSFKMEITEDVLDQSNEELKIMEEAGAGLEAVNDLRLSNDYHRDLLNNSLSSETLVKNIHNDTWERVQKLKPATILEW